MNGRLHQLKSRISRLDLQAKVIVVLFLVIAPTFLLVALAVSQITLPVVEQEMRSLGVHASRVLAEELANQKLLHPGREKELEERLMQTFYLQPNVVQVEAFRITEGESFELAATTDDPSNVSAPPDGRLPERAISLHEDGNDGFGYWAVWSPVKNRRGQLLGAVKMEVSLRAATSLGRAVWKIISIAGFGSIALLLVALSYFLRKTIQNDRKLKLAESHNVELSQQLHEAERQLVIKDKLAVMGQLTASFAHEIGTPLNAVGGHLQLLQEDFQARNVDPGWIKRLRIVTEQLTKIENIVKGFLHSTASPASEPQLTDLNKVMEKTLSIVSPRLESMGVRLEKALDSQLGPVRAVPLDIEQVLLNLLNNSLDSLSAKRRIQSAFVPRLEVFSRQRRDGLHEWLELGVADSGQGISRKNLDRVFQPFYTTKAQGEGTGLGLSICQEIAGKYRGKLEIESKEGAWTKVTFRLPYGAEL